MPTKGTKIKAPRRVGVDKAKLKKSGFAHDPPIPIDQFNGDTKKLRQFKAYYQVDGKGRKDKLLKGLLKDLKTGRLYLANEDKSRYVELTEEQYDNIVKEIGERVGIDGGEPRIGKPFQGRTKEQEVIEESEPEPEPEPQPEPKKLTKAQQKQSENVSDAMIEAAQAKEAEATEAKQSEEEIEGNFVTIDGKEYFKSTKGEYYNIDNPDETIPDPSKAKKPEAKSQSEFKEGNIGIYIKKPTYQSGRFIPSLNIEDDSTSKDFFYRWRDIWWVLSQRLTEQFKQPKVINPDEDDTFDFSRGDQEAEVVGIRGMRGKRRVLIVKPPEFIWTKGDNNTTLYIYDGESETKDTLLSKENDAGGAVQIDVDDLIYTDDPDDYSFVDYSDDEFGEEKELGKIIVKNLPESDGSSEISTKDADYLETFDEEEEEDKFRIENIDSFESMAWWAEVRKYSTLGKADKERENIFNEYLEEILSEETEEQVKKILEDMGVIDTKKVDMPSTVADKSKKIKIKVTKEQRKPLTQAQLDALAAARAKRKAKKEGQSK